MATSMTQQKVQKNQQPHLGDLNSLWQHNHIVRLHVKKLSRTAVQLYCQVLFCTDVSNQNRCRALACFVIAGAARLFACSWHAQPVWGHTMSNCACHDITDRAVGVYAACIAAARSGKLKICVTNLLGCSSSSYLADECVASNTHEANRNTVCWGVFVMQQLLCTA